MANIGMEIEGRKSPHSSTLQLMHTSAPELQLVGVMNRMQQRERNPTTPTSQEAPKMGSVAGHPTYKTHGRFNPVSAHIRLLQLVPETTFNMFNPQYDYQKLHQLITDATEYSPTVRDELVSVSWNTANKRHMSAVAMCCEKGWARSLYAILNSGFDSNTTVVNGGIYRGCGLLHVAACNGNAVCVQLLLCFGGDSQLHLYSSHVYPMTPLMLCVAKATELWNGLNPEGYFQVVQQFFHEERTRRCGNNDDHKGFTVTAPLFMHPYCDTASLLLKHMGIVPGYHNHDDTQQHSLAREVSPTPNNEIACGGISIMHLAVSNLQTCKLLHHFNEHYDTNKYMSINIPDQQSRRPLHYLVLTATGLTSPNILSDPTALLATTSPSLSVQKFQLIKQRIELVGRLGADVNAQDIYGNTVLHYVVQNQMTSLIAPLLEIGADKRAENDRKVRPSDMMEDANTSRTLENYVPMWEYTGYGTKHIYRPPTLPRHVASSSITAATKLPQRPSTSLGISDYNIAMELDTAGEMGMSRPGSRPSSANPDTRYSQTLLSKPSLTKGATTIVDSSQLGWPCRPQSGLSTHDIIPFASDDDDHQPQSFHQLYIQLCKLNNMKANKSLLNAFPMDIHPLDIKEIDLSKQPDLYFGQKGFTLFCAAIQHCKRLEKLNMSNMKLSTQEIILLCKQLQIHPAMTYLDLSNTPLPTHAAKAVVELSEKNEAMLEITVRNTGMPKDQVAIIKANMEKHTQKST